MKRRKDKKESGSLFTTQCLVSLALIGAGIVIYNSQTPFLQPAKVAFSQVLSENTGIEGIAETLNTFAEKIGIFENED